MIDNVLLVSCPGFDGGLFLLNGSSSVRLTDRPATGVFVGDKTALFAYQDDSGKAIRVSRNNSGQDYHLDAEAMDLHDVLVVDGMTYAVATQTNSVICFDSDYGRVGSWSLEGEIDSAHLNSIAHYQGKFLVSIFGRFERHRQYKEGTSGKGEVLDIITGETFITGLSQPHSLTVVGEYLYMCNSESREVRIYCGTELIDIIPVPGYARGLVVTGDHIYVGLSASRNTSHSSGGASNAEVCVIDRKSFQVVGRLGLSCREIYDIRVLNDIKILTHLIVQPKKSRAEALEEESHHYKHGYESYRTGYNFYKSSYESCCKELTVINRSFFWRVCKPFFELEKYISSKFY